MYRRKVMVAASALFALGVAFAAQPTSLRDDRSHPATRTREPWVPGTNMVMDAQEAGGMALAPPR